MEILGNRNLLLTEYIIGTELPNINNSGQISDVEFLLKWIHFKENASEMQNYRCERTNNISILYIIEIDEFKEILKDLVLIYKKSYQHGEKSDFIDHVFKYTITFLRKFLSLHNENFVAYFTPDYIHKNIYFCDKFYEQRIIDLVIEPSKDIHWLKQYYSKILKEILNLDYDNINNQTIINSPNTKIVNDKLIGPLEEELNPEGTKIFTKNQSNQSSNLEAKNYTPKEEISTEKYLFFLNGKTLQKNERYIDEKTYRRLIEYSNFYFKHLKLPENIQPIKSPHFKVGELRYAFYLIFKDLHPNREYPKSLFDFIGKVFPLLKDPKNRKFRQTANYKKFNNKPQYWDELMKKNQ